MTQKSVCEIELNETQYDALAALNDAACDVAFLIGGIGSGKTFLLAAALEKYANENKIMSDKFNVLEEKINKIEQKNILLENENIKLIEKIQAFDTHNKYIETTYTTIINTNQNKLDNFLWILASIIAVFGLFGFSAVSKYINTKLNKIISKKQNELDVLIENVKNLEKGLKFEYLQKLAEFSQHNKKSGETTQAEKDWLIYYAELLSENEDERTFEDWRILAFKYFYVDNDFEGSTKSIEKSIKLNPKFNIFDKYCVKTVEASFLSNWIVFK